MYPLKFQPLFQKRLWGGQRLRTLLGKALPSREPFGESWELADLPTGTVKADSAGAAADGSYSNAIINGPWAGKTLADIWNAGKPSGGSNHFPLLIKFLDANQDLSIQVHPDEAYCRSHPGAHLKSEAWVILHAEPGARIYKGVRPDVTKDEFLAALEIGAVEPLLNSIPVRVGDCHYLPSGTVHALGAGIVAAEVQTPSDTTFRVFDYNRLTAEGKPRALHVADALECIRFGPVEQPPSKPPPSAFADAHCLAGCEFFTINRVRLPQSFNQPVADEWAIWIVLEGQGVIASSVGPTAFTRGDVLLLPAGMESAVVRTIARCMLLEIRFPMRGVIQ